MEPEITQRGPVINGLPGGAPSPSEQLMEIIRQHQEDPLANFYRSLCNTVRSFRPENVVRIKRTLCAAMLDMELEELQGEEETGQVETTQEDPEDDVFE